jgi:hypothetical protein
MLNLNFICSNKEEKLTTTKWKMALYPFILLLVMKDNYALPCEEYDVILNQINLQLLMIISMVLDAMYSLQNLGIPSLYFAFMIFGCVASLITMLTGLKLSEDDSWICISDSTDPYIYIVPMIFFVFCEASVAVLCFYLNTEGGSSLPIKEHLYSKMFMLCVSIVFVSVGMKGYPCLINEDDIFDDDDSTEAPYFSDISILLLFIFYCIFELIRMFYNLKLMKNMYLSILVLIVFGLLDVYNLLAGIRTCKTKRMLDEAYLILSLIHFIIQCFLSFMTWNKDISIRGSNEDQLDVNYVGLEL